MKAQLIALVDSRSPVVVTVSKYCATGRIGEELFLFPEERDTLDPILSSGFATFQVSNVREIKQKVTIGGRTVTQIDLKA